MIAGGTARLDIEGMNYFEKNGFVLGYRFPSQKFENVVGDSSESNFMGFYSLAGVEDGNLVLSRDVLGGRPLYFSINDGVQFCSCKRFLKNPLEVEKGERLVLSPDGEVVYKERKRFQDVYQKDRYINDLDNIVEELEEILIKNKPEGSVISFSGGLDSSLLASVFRLPLISVTSSEKEEKILREGAESLGLPISLKKFSERDLEEVLPEVIRAIESSNPLQVSIAIPLYLSAMEARELGFKSVVLGQGADELFGGYSRYVKVLERYGYKSLEDELIKDLMEIGVKNLIRDSKISYAVGIAMITPYLSAEMIKLSLRIPPEFKIKREGNIFIRKYVLRKVAEKYLDKKIALREKKAIQYSTGTVKILRKISKKRGYTIKRYLELIRDDIG